MRHADSCPHGHQNIAGDPGNYFDGPLNALQNFFIGGPAPQVAAQQPVAQPAPVIRPVLETAGDILNRVLGRVPTTHRPRD
jgi:hypothetical protein